MHHLLGSFGSLKISDSLIAPMTRTEHNKADLNREEYFNIYLPKSINLLQEYITDLEETINKLKGK